MRKPWVQVAIDATDLGKAKELAEIAVSAGADWIEAGTPLIYFESIRSIGALAGWCKGIPVVADFKAQDGVYKYFREAAENGAKVATVLAVANDGSIREAVRAGKDYGIKVCADLFSVPLPRLPERAREVERLGADYVMLHLGFDESKYDSGRKSSDGLKEVAEAVSLPIGVATYDIEDALEAIELGASYVVQGEPILSGPDSLRKLSEFISAVKNARIGQEGTA